MTKLYLDKHTTKILELFQEIQVEFTTLEEFIKLSTEDRNDLKDSIDRALNKYITKDNNESLPNRHLLDRYSVEVHDPREIKILLLQDLMYLCSILERLELERPEVLPNLEILKLMHTIEKYHDNKPMLTWLLGNTADIELTDQDYDLLIQAVNAHKPCNGNYIYLATNTTEKEKDVVREYLAIAKQNKSLDKKIIVFKAYIQLEAWDGLLKLVLESKHKELSKEDLDNVKKEISTQAKISESKVLNKLDSYLSFSTDAEIKLYEILNGDTHLGIDAPSKIYNIIERSEEGNIRNIIRLDQLIEVVDYFINYAPTNVDKYWYAVDNYVPILLDSILTKEGCCNELFKLVSNKRVLKFPKCKEKIKEILQDDSVSFSQDQEEALERYLSYTPSEYEIMVLTKQEPTTKEEKEYVASCINGMLFGYLPQDFTYELAELAMSRSKELGTPEARLDLIWKKISHLEPKIVDEATDPDPDQLLGVIGGKGFPDTDTGDTE